MSAKRNWKRSALSLLVGLSCLFGASQAHAITTVFTGADPGEGLDFQGDFLYAVNTRGPGGFSIGEAAFTSDQGNATAGYTHNANSEILNWANPNYGASTDDNNLELVMRSIRHGAPGGNHTIDLANLEAGREYKLQLMFTESCCNRAFDVSVNGTQIADNFNIPTTQGGINNSPANGALITYEFKATSSTANIVLNGPAAAGAGTDLNPTISALTLEDISGQAYNVAQFKPATATSVYPNALFVPGKAVNEVTNDAQGNQWLAGDGVTSASLTIDLLGLYDISEIQLLNTGNAGFLDRATGTFSIDVAGDNGVFIELVSERALQLFTAGFQSELVNVGGIQFVRFNMLSIIDPDPNNQFPLAGGGLNEIRVIGTSHIPEPATAALALMGMGGLFMRRRRVA